MMILGFSRDFQKAFPETGRRTGDGNAIAERRRLQF
jgi:hypothetical protein